MGLRPGHSAVGSASALGAEGREFESRCPDHFFCSLQSSPLWLDFFCVLILPNE